MHTLSTRCGGGCGTHPCSCGQGVIKGTGPAVTGHVAVFVDATGTRIGDRPTLLLTETTAPAAPGGDTALVWLQDNGAGKSQLMIQFATGVPIALATEL